MRWAIVSGSSTGIGEAITLRLLSENINVIAGVRKDADAQRLMTKAQKYAAELVTVNLDVTKDEQIAATMEKAKELTGSYGLWALINNAGIVVPGPLEFLSRDAWRYQFEVNFFGMVEMTRLALPLLRQAVTTQGAQAPRVMLVSSIGGRVPQPMISAYTASKFATTALGDSLRLELKSQHIGVTVLEPGAIATAIWGKGVQDSAEYTPDHPARKHYSQEIDGLTAITKKTSKMAISAEKAAAVAVKALLARKAPPRVLVGSDARLAAILKQTLPIKMFDELLLKQFGIKGTTT